MRKVLLLNAAQILLTLLLANVVSAADDALAFRESPGKIEIFIGEKPFATYVYRDETILRPYFANVHARGGWPVTRPHPPSAEQGDSTDHETMHPGIWLAFADISGVDFWRNKAKVEHVEFTKAPSVEGDTGTFVVRNRYVDGDRTVCEEVCRHTVTVGSDGYLLEYDSTFTGGEDGAIFGDQEEFGLGIRMNDRLKADGGAGRILNSDGKVNGEKVRGTNARWCDYSGIQDGKRSGVLIMPHPENFRPSWYHARDYGLLVANPFGEHALTGGLESGVELAKGQTLRLRFGIFVYSVPGDEDIKRDEIYQAYVGERGA